MKKKLSHFIAVMVLTALFLASIPYDVQKASAYSNVNVSNVKVSGSSLDIGGSASFSFNLSSSVKISHIDIGVIHGNYGVVSVPADKIISSGTVTCSVDIGYSGSWGIDYISLYDANGNVYCFYDKNNSQDMYEPGSMPIDMSRSKFTVENKAGDYEAPVIDTASVYAEKSTCKVGEGNKIYVNISDNVKVTRVDYEVKTGQGPVTAFAFASHVSGNKWALEVPTDYNGKYEIVSISAQDSNANTAVIYNSSYSQFEDYGYETANLSKGNFQVKASAGGAKDKKGPEIISSSVSVSTRYASLGSNVTISVKVTDDSKIVDVTPFIKTGRGGVCEFGGGMTYDSSTGKHSITLDCNYYGTWELAGISALDSSGNFTYLYSTGYSDAEGFIGYFGEPTSKKNLSAANFYVGITDPATGIFISGDGMSNNVSMNVSTLSQKGDTYEKLYQKGYKVIDFCNIKVNGKYSEGGKHIRVEFPVSGIKNGGQILIKHLCSNGKIQITAATVSGGKVHMNVTDFSPFILLGTDSGQLLESDIKKIESGLISETGSSDDEGSVSEDNTEADTSSEGSGDSLTDSDSDSAVSQDGKTQTPFLGPSAPTLAILAIIVLGAAAGAVYYVKFKRKK